jgi:hypothetical protein
MYRSGCLKRRKIDCRTAATGITAFGMKKHLWIRTARALQTSLIFRRNQRPRLRRNFFKKLGDSKIEAWHQISTTSIAFASWASVASLEANCFESRDALTHR